MARDETGRLRQGELAACAPIVPRKLWRRVGDRVYLCATIGAEFDQWQRRLAAVSAADAYFAQRIGLDAVERLMDELEAEIRPTLAADETLNPRRSPGYGEMPLSMSREILDTLDATRRLGVMLTASMLLVPSKSVTAVCEISHCWSTDFSDLHLSLSPKGVSSSFHGQAIVERR